MRKFFISLISSLVLWAAAAAAQTTVTFPVSGAVVGTTDTQTLTNKSIDGGEINTGTISVNRFNAGAGASNTTYLRGDGTWATPAGGGGGGGGGRTVLTANLSMYVSATGVDTGNCENSAAPCATPTYAYQWAQRNLDLAAYTVTVNFQTGYSGIAGWTFAGPLVGAGGAQSFVFAGTGTNPSATTISATVSPAYLFFAEGGAQFTVENMQLQSTGTGSADLIISQGEILASNIWFGPTANAFVDTAGPASIFGCFGTGLIFLINSNPNIGFVAEDNSMQALGCPLTVSGNPNWTTAFVQADLGGIIDGTNATITPASATGRRFNASLNGIVFSGSNGCPATYWPGSVAGQTSAGGLCP